MELPAEITYRIYKGATAEDLGLPVLNWASRKATLAVFLHGWSGTEETFRADYIAWLKTQQHLRPPLFPGTALLEVLAQLPPDVRVRIHGKPEPQLPSATQMAKNLAVSAADYAKSGFKNVGDAVYAARVAVCTGCPYFRSDQRCAKCGCFMRVKAKWESARCPMGSWPDDKG